MLKDLSNISAKDGCQMDRVGDLILMDPVGGSFRAESERMRCNVS